MLNVKAEMVVFSCFWGGSDQLVGSQIARLSSLGIVVLSGVLSPRFDLNSSVVRNVLRGCISHVDIAAVWMTQPLASSTVSCLLEACQLRTWVVSARNSITTRLVGLLCIVPAKALPFGKYRWICALVASHSENV